MHHEFPPTWKTAKKAIQKAIKTRQKEELRKAAHLVTLCILAENPLSENIFCDILQLLVDPTLDSLDGNCHFVSEVQQILRNDQLSTSQQNRLLPVLEQCFRNNRDPLSLWYIREILARDFANETAFDILQKLRDCKGDDHRREVAKGFADFAERVSDFNLTSRLRNTLAELVNDRDSDVRQVARLGLEKLDIGERQ